MWQESLPACGGPAIPSATISFSDVSAVMFASAGCAKAITPPSLGQAHMRFAIGAADQHVCDTDARPMKHMAGVVNGLMLTTLPIGTPAELTTTRTWGSVGKL